MRRFAHCRRQCSPPFRASLHAHAAPSVARTNELTLAAVMPVEHRGTHGFVQLALDTRTNVRMAIKFIPRDQKMQTKSVLRYGHAAVAAPIGCRRGHCSAPSHYFSKQACGPSSVFSVHRDAPVFR